MARLHLGYQVLIAVIAGIFMGLFLGPLVSIFQPISSVYVMLLQMVVLPYVCISIIHGLGSLSPLMAKRLFIRSWFFWLALWGIVFFVIFLVAYLIPTPIAAPLLESGRAVLIKKTLAENILTYLIPENPIYDFINNIVPSIAIFGIIMGFALMHIDKKEPLLSAVERSDEVIEKILSGLAIVSPIGVFAHIAGGMGTIRLSQFVQIDFYLISFIVITLFITFWILPLILSSLTPLSFWESLKAFRMVCLLPFVTGIPTIAIPFINIYMKKLSQKYSFNADSSFRSTAQTIIPISYSFAQIGNCLLLFFILFASFYFRHPFSGSEKTLISFLTIPLSIGSSVTSVNSVSFLFKELNFPDNALELFTETIPLTMNFQVLLSVAGVLTFIILVLFANYGLLKVNWKKIVYKLFTSMALITAVVFWISPKVHLTDNYRDLYANLKITEAIKDPVAAIVDRSGKTSPDPSRQGDIEIFDQILKSGVLRVGYGTSSMPYAYFNASNELVGFDIAMAYQLSKDLNCRLEFIPIDYAHLSDQIQDGVYDIAVGAVLMTEDRILKMGFSDTYADQNYVLIVSKNKQSQFSDLETILQRKGIVIGAIGAYEGLVKSIFPHATLYAGSEEKGYEMDRVDAWMSCQVSASIWCFSHPDYNVLNYGGQLGKCYLAYPMKTEAPRFLRFMNNWIQIKILNEFYQEQHDYWILGKSLPKEQEPRWSIIRNVLHWIN